MVSKYYSDIKSLPTVSDQEMNIYLVELSRVRKCAHYSAAKFFVKKIVERFKFFGSLLRVYIQR